MEKLVKVVNKLQDAFAAAKITCPFDLPQIVVLGEQSSGKSSVLEKFVGRDFLPRGAGIVTRRPLILQLVNQNGPEYGVFFHNKSRKYTDFDEIRKEIDLETDRVTGKNKNISPLPINLRIYSPNVLTLTLVDLPGVTNVAVGDQPADIGAQIREMIMQFISNPNSLILAVIPAVTDIANSEALKMSQAVDPDRLRTIGVVTKIDMMGEGTDCMDVLTNKVYPLTRGFVGVVNRSQKDIVHKKDIDTAKNDELMFFKQHPVYKSLGDRVGTEFLQKTLSEQLGAHILNTLPVLKESIMNQLSAIKTKIDENPVFFLGDGGADNCPLTIVVLLLQDLIQYIDTQLGYDAICTNLDEISSGSKISWTLSSRFFLEFEKIRPLPETVKHDIYIALRNTLGVRRGGIAGDAAFFAVMRQQFQFIQSPCLKVLEVVRDLIKDLFNQAAEKILKPFPELKSFIYTCLQDKLITYFNESKEFIEFMAKIQADHINTNHPDFLAAQEPSDQDDLYRHQKLYIINSENIIFREGPLHFLNISTLVSSKQFYCMLKGQILFVYVDSLKTNLREIFDLNDCKIKDMTHRSEFKFVIFSKSERSLHKSCKSLEVRCETIAQKDGWMAAFVSCGIELDRPKEKSKPEDGVIIDSAMRKDIEYVYLMVDSYLKITLKSMHDLLLKVIINSMILKIRDHLFSELVITVTELPNIEDYMEQSEEIKQEREHLCAMNRSCEDALEIIEMFEKENPCQSMKYRQLPPIKTPKPQIEKTELTKSDPHININKSYHSLPVQYLSDINLDEKPARKSSTSKRNPDAPMDQTKTLMPRKPPPKNKTSIFYD